MRLLVLIALCAVFAADFCGPVHAQNAPPNSCPVYTMTRLKGPTGGGRVDWRPDGLAIAADRRNPSNGCYDVWEMDTKGADLRCLTCNRPDLPKLNKGNPAYHPGGHFIVFQAEKDSHMGKDCGLFVNPGAGEYNDLWVMNLQTGKAALLYAVTDGMQHGTLHAHFSHDGTKLLWSEMYHISGFSPPNKAGRWKLNIADVVISGDSMTLKNVRSILPTDESGEGMAESHGFTPDDRRIIFSGNLGYDDLIWKHNDIFTTSLEGTHRQVLTGKGYNEHGQISPSGRSMAWMATLWNSSLDEREGTEFYIKGLSGGAICQLSHFNTKGYPESQASVTNGADIAWSPDGRQFVAYSHDRPSDLSDLQENIWLYSFRDPQ